MNVTLNLNNALNGIELKFSQPPPADVREKLGRNGLGFRWHNKNKYWFAKQTPERLAYARQLAGLQEEKPSEQEGPKTEVYRYYSTQRPVDLGTYPKAGGAFLNFENFDQRQSVEDGAFLAWGWLDYSRPLTQQEMSDYELRPSLSTQEKANTAKSVSSPVPEHEEKEQEITVSKPNTFAAHYDCVGDIKILDSSDVGFFDFRNAAYFRDLNLFVHRTGCGDCLSVLSLENAGKSGQVCNEWKLTVKAWPSEDICINLFNEHEIHTVKDLWEKCLCDQAERTRFMVSAEDIRVSNYQHKAVNIFSPFVEVKPLKSVPEKWTKKNFAQALMSGQIYCGETTRHTSDDYAYDASVGFRAGVRLDMADQARDVVEGWGSLSSVSTAGEPDEHGISTLRFSDGPNTYKTLWFDLNCDIAEGKRREDVRNSGIRQYNDMLKSSCIHPDAKGYDPNRIYTVQSLELNDNTGVLYAKEENIQGYLLCSRLEDDYAGDILSIRELDIQPDRLYQISSSQSSHSIAEQLAEDDRVISCGNWQNFVTGKALLEMNAECIYVPVILEAQGEYATPERALATLESFIRGAQFYGVNNPGHDGYTLAAKRLVSETERAKSEPTKSLEEMLQSARTRQSEQQTSRGAGRDKIIDFPNRF